MTDPGKLDETKRLADELRRKAEDNNGKDDD